MNTELKRFDVKLTRSGEHTQHTFTWATSREDAHRRMAKQMAEQAAQCPDLWSGWTFTVASEPSQERNPALTLPEDTESLWALLADVMEALQQAGEDPRLEVDGQWEVQAIRRAPEHGPWARKVEWTNSSGAWRWTYQTHAD